VVVDGFLLFDIFCSNVVNNSVNTRLGAPEVIVNGFAGVQVTKEQRAPEVSASHKEEMSEHAIRASDEAMISQLGVRNGG
jgi:hypothetical protein